MKDYLLSKEDEEPKLRDSLTPGTSEQAAPVPMVREAVQPPMAPPSMQSVPPLPVAKKPAPKLPGMPLDVTGDQLEQYLGRQKESLNKYGPEAQMDLQQKTLADRNSLGSRLTSGAKGFADALMMGVAGAGNPGWQREFENQQDRQAAEQMGTMQRAGELNTQRTATNMNIDRMDPKSAVSKSIQQSYAPLFEKLGYEPNAITSMSAANIENAVNLMAQFGGKQVEAMIKKYEMEIQNAQFQETKRHNRAEETTQAAESVLKGSKIPFIGPSHAQKVEAADTLAAQSSGAPYGLETERNGVTYRWSPSTQKYHKVQ